MASERRSYTKLPNAILHAGLDDRALATLVRLQLYLSVRWSVGRLRAEEAGEAFLDAAAMMLVTGQTNVSRARRSLLGHAAVTQASRMRIQERDGGVVVSWPAFVEYQGFEAREKSRSQGVTPPKYAPPASASASEEEELREEKTHASHEAPAGAAHPPPANDPARWVSILGAEPGSAEEKRAFVERELPLAVAEAEQHHPRDRKAQRGKIKSVLIRHYRWQRDHPVPMAARARDRPQTFHEISVENSKEAARDSLDFAERLVRQREEARSNGIRRIGATAGSAAPRLLDVPVPRARDGE